MASEPHGGREAAEADARAAHVREQVARQVYDLLLMRRQDQQFMAGTALFADRLRAVASAQKTGNDAMIRQAYMDIAVTAAERAMAIDFEATNDYGI